MSFMQSAYDLLFDPKMFFAEKREGLLVPIVLTVVYAIVSGVSSLLLLSMTDLGVPAEVGGFVSAVGVVSTVVAVGVCWFVVAALFFACLKFIGYAECSYREVLSVCGYVSGILLLYAVVSVLVSLIGQPHAFASLVLSGVFLLWSVPVWYFGLQSVCAIPEKKLRTAVLVPVLIMVVYAVITNVGALGL